MKKTKKFLKEAKQAQDTNISTPSAVCDVTMTSEEKKSSGKRRSRKELCGDTSVVEEEVVVKKKKKKTSSDHIKVEVKMEEESLGMEEKMVSGSVELEEEGFKPHAYSQDTYNAMFQGWYTPTIFISLGGFFIVLSLFFVNLLA